MFPICKCYYSICPVELSIRYAQNLNGSLNLEFSKVPDFNNVFSSQLLSQYSVLIAKHISWQNMWRMWDSWSSNTGSFISIIVSAILISTKEKRGRKVSHRREAEITSAFHISNNMNNIYVTLTHIHCLQHSVCTAPIHTLLFDSVNRCCLLAADQKTWGEKKAIPSF